MEISTNVVEEKKLDEQVVSEYEVRGYRICIFIENGSLYYSAKPRYNFNQDPLLFTELSSLVYKNKERLGKDILKFDELVDTLKSICMWKILEIENLPVDPDIFAELFIYKLINYDPKDIYDYTEEEMKSSKSLRGQYKKEIGPVDRSSSHYSYEFAKILDIEEE